MRGETRSVLSRASAPVLEALSGRTKQGQSERWPSSLVLLLYPSCALLEIIIPDRVGQAICAACRPDDSSEPRESGDRSPPHLLRAAACVKDQAQDETGFLV